MKILTYIGIVAAAALLIVLSYLNRPPAGSLESERQIEPIISVSRIEKQIRSMTLDEKIGQMMIVGFENTYPDAHIVKMIRDYHVGGVNLLKRNVQNAAQVRELTASLKAVSASSSPIPFMIAVDQEGGKYSRFVFLEHQKPQTSLKTEDQARDEGWKRGNELVELGIIDSFGPVVDFTSDKKSYLYGRTFGTTAQKIGGLAIAMRDGYAKSGVRSIFKHFPGYGNIMDDPHSTSAALESLKLYEESLIPWKEILYGKNTGAVMTAHIVIREIDSRPATFSQRFIKDILRDEWKFEGVIITDDLEMASAGKSSVPELAVAAIKAGNDMIISTFTPALHVEMHDAIKKAVINGEIQEEEINKSVKRILEFKS